MIKLATNDLEWGLKLQEIKDAAKQLNRFSIQDISKKIGEKESIVRPKVQILKNLGIIKSTVIATKIIYEYIGENKK